MECFMPVFAYLDPGTGSFIIQMAVGTVVAAAAIVKTQWKKIKSYFSKK